MLKAGEVTGKEKEERKEEYARRRRGDGRKERSSRRRRKGKMRLMVIWELGGEEGEVEKRKRGRQW